MSKWTKTVDEYNQVRQIILDAMPGPAFVTLKGGKILKGWIVGTNSGTDVGENLAAGRGPIITSMYGEVKLRLEAGETLLIDAVEIQAIGQAPMDQISN